MEVDDIISYHDVVAQEKIALQKGMNYGVGKGYSVFLMSLRENAPYADAVDPVTGMLMYEGNDEPQRAGAPNPKELDQPLTTLKGSWTENGKFFRAAMDMRKHVLAIALVTSLLGLASCSCDEDASPTVARGHGRVKIVYDDAGIKPENRDVVKQIRDSRVFERLADRTTKTVALPHDLVVKVSDDVPFDDPTTEVDGRTIFWPAAFLNTTRSLLVEFVPEVIRDKGVPKAIGTQNFTPDTLNIWANQFILGHELGHALIHQLTLPLTGMEEDSADGFATFFTIIDKETGPNAALGAAVLFDAFAAKKPSVTMEDFSSDHPVVQQRIFNFLCAVVGSDPQKLESSLVTDGYVPQVRAGLCRKEWTQLNFGWWKVLEPHIADTYKEEADAARVQARRDLEKENAALPGKIRELRRQQGSR